MKTNLNRKIVHPNKLPLSLIPAGILLIAFSLFFSSSILAFIGLGLLFWGILFIYIKTGENENSDLLDVMMSSQIALVDQLLKDQSFAGDAIYLAPRYFKNPDIQRIYVSKTKTCSLPNPIQIQGQETHLYLQAPSALLLTPPGIELIKLWEKRLKTNFAGVDLIYLQQNLPRLLVEELHVGSNVDMTLKEDQVIIAIDDVRYPAPDLRTSDHAANLPFVGHQLSSAFACAIAKSTGQCVLIEKQLGQKKGNITIEYSLIKEEGR
jgi:hypothetical protein